MVRTAVRPASLLTRLALPALAVGVASSLLLIAVSEVAQALEDVLWRTLPDALGVGRYAAGWVIAVLTAAGIAVGLVVWRVPGRAGPDPATTALVDPPLPARVVPGLLLAAVLSLAGGVSLGPENPITAANIALAYWLGRRYAPAGPGVLWVSLAAAGTVGALFGTPVAAALVLTEALAGPSGALNAPEDGDGGTKDPGTGGGGTGGPGTDPADAGDAGVTGDAAGSAGGPGAALLTGPLWDRLFAPLVAAGAGGLTTTLIAHPVFELTLPAFTGPGWGDLLAALVTATAGALAGLAAVALFPPAHRAFHALRHPVAVLTAGGVVLGLLGVLGGHLTLFKGLDQIRELTAGQHSAGALLLMTGVKLLALTAASAAGFRGGRIFPTVFAGVALGLAAHALVPAVHPAVGVSAAVLGLLLAVTRQGWLSLFTAAVLAPVPGVLPLLVLATLPAWLLVTGRPLMQLDERGRPLR
ncbi:chloride channel protein [Streptomyces sp. NPDC089919]|uniref:chloride channel protein n=1 Tax=Streptomyces sp. NPDC089919 TaxID=3155188 RepID=UPI003420B671